MRNYGTRVPITPMGVKFGVVAPDGLSIVASTDSGYLRFTMDGRTPQRVPGLRANDAVIRFRPDGLALWVRRVSDLPVQVERIDLATGRRTPLLTIHNSTRPGMVSVGTLSLADNPQTYVYSAREVLSHLFELTRTR